MVADAATASFIFVPVVRNGAPFSGGPLDATSRYA
jgi:hypothetical protein